MKVQPSTKTIGKRFALIAWFFIIALLYLFFADTLEKQWNPNQTVTSSGQSVVLKRNKMGHYVTSGSINGYPVVFMLDTGATTVAIPAHLANKLDLTPGKAHQVNTANGLTTAYNTELNSLSIGDLTLLNVRGSLVEGFKGDEILLGMSALKQLSFTQQGDTLTLSIHR